MRWFAPLLGIPLLGAVWLSEEAFAKNRGNKDPGLGTQTGIISWYGKGFHGRRTASGERYNMHEMTCASRHLPFGTLLEVTNPQNGNQVILRVNDRGPYRRPRVLDVSFGAAKKLGFLNSGYITAEIRRLPLDFELRRQESEQIESLGFHESFLKDLDSLAGNAVQACVSGKPRKKPECLPFHEIAVGSL